jgi:beta-phosphoglucomutase
MQIMQSKNPLARHTYQAVIFDLDGVLTDTAHYHFLAWKKLAESVGASFDEHFNESLKGVDRMGSLNLILATTERTFTEQEKLVLADQKNQHYQQLIEHMSPADLLPGAREALVSVRAAGLKTALASVSKNAFSVISKLQIADLFDDVVDAALIAQSKPDPEIFLTAAAHLGITPADCLGVEDSIAGLKAIKSAGMFALGIGQASVLTDADVVIDGLHQFHLEDYWRASE